MIDPVALNDRIWISGQIAAEDLADAAARLGVRKVVNNRPDHEDLGQPTSAEIGAAAESAGLAFLDAPVRGLPDPATVDRVGQFLEDGEPTLLFCRSGMRSAVTWAMAERARGVPADDLREQALAAGYDLSRVPL
ncbi:MULTISPECIES: TIGR01244 family sulfur transferase [unclassified Brevundimonas]|uniref:TIGR01244 family sulfur transferase n=1 Tax=unclassified Brevundimonas TaxID=2622653 RepID=UPI0025BB8A6D|nr:MULTISPECIES: TIGR01244 family sulfur transferase [unclassified Brevundimonas]